ncbi:MAG: hypothetical protein WKF97_20905 [Chitinophagaceae bacterium]
MNATNENNYVSIKLNNDEALVLLEWLQSFNIEGHSALFQDQAEERILFNLEAELEKVVSETFKEDYQTMLLKARQSIRDEQ